MAKPPDTKSVPMAVGEKEGFAKLQNTGCNNYRS